MDMIMTPNVERNWSDATGYLTFEMPSDGTVYVAFDGRATSPPKWMCEFFPTGDRIYTSLSSQPHFNVYAKTYDAGECVNFGANRAPGHSGNDVNNYFVFYSDNNTSQTFFSFEAEDGDINNSMVASADNNASSGMFIWAPNGGGSGGYAEYSFDVKKAGNYVVWGRVLSPNGDDNSFNVSMDGGADSLWDTTISSNWVWNRVSHRNGSDPVVYNLSVGNHTLVIKQREDGTKLDRIVIIGDANTALPTDSVNIEFEAEDGDIKYSMVASADNNASSGMFIWAPNGGGSGGYAEYSFDVKKAGNYVVWGRALSPNGDDNSFNVSMDGGADSLWDTTISSSWVWNRVSHRNGSDPVVYNLSVGNHTLVIKQREDGTKLDRIVITNDMTTVPNTPSVPAPVSINIDIEAEDGDINNSMVASADNNASSGMFIWAPNGGVSGGYAEYSFDVEEAGNYIVWGRVQSPNGDDNSFYVSMDGGADSLWDTTISSSWVWNRVSHRNGSDPVVYNLSMGNHTLVIKQREDGTKLDEIIITDDLSLRP